MPPGVVLPVAGDADACRALTKLLQPIERALHLGLGSDDADEVLHHFLQGILHVVGTLSGRAAVEWLERAAGRLVGLRAVDSGSRVAGRISSGIFAGAFAEHKDV